jgi:hypothetical protein
VSVWVFVAILTALGGALILWHAVSQTKHVSEQLLTTYRQMLVQARDERAKKLGEKTEPNRERKPGGQGPAANERR